MKMMPPDVITHENQLQHVSEPSIFILDVFRTADHAGQIFIPHRILLREISKGISHFIILKQSVLQFQFHLYNYDQCRVWGSGPPSQKHYKKLVPFHFKTMIHAHIHTHVVTYYGICVCMDTYMLEYY